LYLNQAFSYSFYILRLSVSCQLRHWTPNRFNIIIPYLRIEMLIDSIVKYLNCDLFLSISFIVVVVVVVIIIIFIITTYSSVCICICITSSDKIKVSRAYHYAALPFRGHWPLAVVKLD